MASYFGSRTGHGGSNPASVPAEEKAASPPGRSLENKILSFEVPHYTSGRGPFVPDIRPRPPRRSKSTGGDHLYLDPDPEPADFYSTGAYRPETFLLPKTTIIYEPKRVTKPLNHPNAKQKTTIIYEPKRVRLALTTDVPSYCN